MKCELYLRRKNSIPFTVLRLPDVIGPYDNTDRFWTTLECMKNHPILISSEDEHLQLSFVDSFSVV